MTVRHVDADACANLRCFDTLCRHAPRKCRCSASHARTPPARQQKASQAQQAWHATYMPASACCRIRSHHMQQCLPARFCQVREVTGARSCLPPAHAATAAARSADEGEGVRRNGNRPQAARPRMFQQYIRPARTHEMRRAPEQQVPSPPDTCLLPLSLPRCRLYKAHARMRMPFSAQPHTRGTAGGGSYRHALIWRRYRQEVCVARARRRKRRVIVAVAAHVPKRQSPGQEYRTRHTESREANVWLKGERD